MASVLAARAGPGVELAMRMLLAGGNVRADPHGPQQHEIRLRAQFSLQAADVELLHATGQLRQRMEGNEMRSIFLMLAIAGLAAAQTPPVGLWQNTEEGFVIRIQTCGQGICGFAAGAPKSGKKKPEEVCGKTILSDFLWNEKSKRWEGRMQPPGTDTLLSASILSDGKSFLTIKGKVLIISKTIQFVPFKGRIVEGCRVLE